MPVKSDVGEIEAIARATFRTLREMDQQPARGLCDYVSCSPFAGKSRKTERAITWGVTDGLRKHWQVEQNEHRYPGTRKRCDRIVELNDSSRVWLEIKLAWRTWFWDSVQHNAPFMYNGYFDGTHHTHSLAGDFAKLEQITAADGRYIALLLVGFDGCDGKMADDLAALSQKERLVDRGWHLLSDAWSTRHSNECWHRCWFAWRRLERISEV